MKTKKVSIFLHEQRQQIYDDLSKSEMYPEKCIFTIFSIFNICRYILRKSKASEVKINMAIIRCLNHNLVSQCHFENKYNKTNSNFFCLFIDHFSIMLRKLIERIRRLFSAIYIICVIYNFLFEK